jgi:hypothetical protein
MAIAFSLSIDIGGACDLRSVPTAAVCSVFGQLVVSFVFLSAQCSSASTHVARYTRGSKYELRPAHHLNPEP